MISMENENSKKRSREEFENDPFNSFQDNDNQQSSDNDEDQKPTKMPKLSDDGESGENDESPFQPTTQLAPIPTQISQFQSPLGQFPAQTNPFAHFQALSQFSNPLTPNLSLSNPYIFSLMQSQPNMSSLLTNPLASVFPQFMDRSLFPSGLGQTSSPFPNLNLLQPITPITPTSPTPKPKKPSHKKKKKKDSNGDENHEGESSTTEPPPIEDPKNETQRERARRLIKLSKDDLKKKCKENGLILSGKKGELVQRLMHPENPLNKKNLASVNILTARKVEQLLRANGVENPKGCSQCLRAAIQLNKIKVDKDHVLDTELVTDTCPNCRTEMTATIKDVVAQPDSAIGDDLRQYATFKCPGCQQGWYITKICLGTPTFDDGKQHHHCTKCPGFGICLSDINQKHCENCGEHFLNGMICAFCGEEAQEHPKSPEASPSSPEK